VIGSPIPVEKVLLINADEPEEVRVAVVEDGRLEEVYLEAGTDPTGKGNIFVGRAQNVERGIGAAFVDLGGGVTGFLHASDVVGDALESAPETTRAAEPPDAVGAFGDRLITDLVKPGDLLLVQVSRGPVGHKGPSLTTRISLPGRYVVLLANSTRGGVSRRIDTGAERDRMRSLLFGLEVPAGMAVILRTASNGRTREEVQADLVELYRLWENLRGRLLEGGGPRLVHEESDLVSRAARDILPPDATRIVADDATVAARIRDYLERTRPLIPRPPAAASAAGSPSDPTRDPSDPEPRADGTHAAAGVPEATDRARASATMEGIGESDVTDAEIPIDAPSSEAPPPVDDATVPSGPAERFAVLDESAAPVADAQEGEGGSHPTNAPMPLAPPVVEVHPGPTPLFHAYGIEAQIEDVFRRTIRLPSGGSIVIDPTEALVAIDVNSGRMTEEEDLETTALKTNLEAVPEVARQLRLRDLGGVIVVDFIDLRERGHTAQIERAMREALRRDRARIRMGRIGPFGCLELTRQRIRPALLSVTHVACPTCAGAGRRRHPVGLALRLLRELRARAARSRGHGGMEVRVPPPVAEVLRKRKSDSLAALEAWLTGPFRLIPDATIAYGSWSIKGLPPRSPAPRPPSAGGAAGSAPTPEATEGAPAGP
jgi:Ribonuclease G/E